MVNEPDLCEIPLPFTPYNNIGGNLRIGVYVMCIHIIVRIYVWVVEGLSEFRRCFFRGFFFTAGRFRRAPRVWSDKMSSG